MWFNKHKKQSWNSEILKKYKVSAQIIEDTRYWHCADTGLSGRTEYRVSINYTLTINKKRYYSGFIVARCNNYDESQNVIIDLGKNKDKLEELVVKSVEKYIHQAEILLGETLEKCKKRKLVDNALNAVYR